MNKHGRVVSINGVKVTITNMDYDGFNGRVSDQFDITFNTVVNDKDFLIKFSNPPQDNPSPYTPVEFKGSGEAYLQFLQEITLSPDYQKSSTTEDEANKAIGEIAQSVYYHVRSHSPDQDEE